MKSGTELILIDEMRRTGPPSRALFSLKDAWLHVFEHRIGKSRIGGRWTKRVESLCLDPIPSIPINWASANSGGPLNRLQESANLSIYTFDRLPNEGLKDVLNWVYIKCLKIENDGRVALTERGLDFIKHFLNYSPQNTKHFVEHIFQFGNSQYVEPRLMQVYQLSDRSVWPIVLSELNGQIAHKVARVIAKPGDRYGKTTEIK